MDADLQRTFRQHVTSRSLGRAVTHLISHIKTVGGLTGLVHLYLNTKHIDALRERQLFVNANVEEVDETSSGFMHGLVVFLREGVPANEEAVEVLRLIRDVDVLPHKYGVVRVDPVRGAITHLAAARSRGTNHLTMDPDHLFKFRMHLPRPSSVGKRRALRRSGVEEATSLALIHTLMDLKKVRGMVDHYCAEGGGGCNNPEGAVCRLRKLADRFSKMLDTYQGILDGEEA